MKMLYCKKCGTAMFADESLAQNVLDKINEAVDRARRCPPRYRNAAIQEAAEYRSVYKALMHNITQKEYAETVSPIILKALTEEIKARKLMTDEEVARIYDEGKALARKRKEVAEKEEARIYGTFKTTCNRANSDPTADAAIDRADRELERRRLR